MDNRSKLFSPNKCHTPGTWERNYNQVVAHHRDAHGNHETLIAEVFDEHVWFQANIRLIVAAPDLLSALEDCIDQLSAYEKSAHQDDDFDLLTTLKLARHAVANARG